jgi:Mor family transcriptional regulator
MQASEALEMIRALAEGVDPTTGEMFDQGSPFQHPQIVRALFAAVEALERRSNTEKRAGRLPENAGKAWGKEEEEQLCQDFDAGMNVAELAKKLKRTRGAVIARLEKLGKISFGNEE